MNTPRIIILSLLTMLCIGSTFASSSLGAPAAAPESSNTEQIPHVTCFDVLTFATTNKKSEPDNLETLKEKDGKTLYDQWQLSRWHNTPRTLAALKIVSAILSLNKNLDNHSRMLSRRVYELKQNKMQMLGGYLTETLQAGTDITSLLVVITHIFAMGEGFSRSDYFESKASSKNKTCMLFAIGALLFRLIYVVWSACSTHRLYFNKKEVRQHLKKIKQLTDAEYTLKKDVIEGGKSASWLNFMLSIGEAAALCMTTYDLEKEVHNDEFDINMTAVQWYVGLSYFRTFFDYAIHINLLDPFVQPKTTESSK